MNFLFEKIEAIDLNNNDKQIIERIENSGYRTLPDERKKIFVYYKYSIKTGLKIYLSCQVSEDTVNISIFKLRLVKKSEKYFDNFLRLISSYDDLNLPSKKGKKILSKYLIKNSYNLLFKPLINMKIFDEYILNDNSHILVYGDVLYETSSDCLTRAYIDFPGLYIASVNYNKDFYTNLLITNINNKDIKKFISNLKEITFPKISDIYYFHVDVYHESNIDFCKYINSKKKIIEKIILHSGYVACPSKDKLERINSSNRTVYLIIDSHYNMRRKLIIGYNPKYVVELEKFLELIGANKIDNICLHAAQCNTYQLSKYFYSMENYKYVLFSLYNTSTFQDLDRFNETLNLLDGKMYYHEAWQKALMNRFISLKENQMGEIMYSGKEEILPTLGELYDEAFKGYKKEIILSNEDGTVKLSDIDWIKISADILKILERLTEFFLKEENITKIKNILMNFNRTKIYKAILKIKNTNNEEICSHEYETEKFTDLSREINNLLGKIPLNDSDIYIIEFALFLVLPNDVKRGIRNEIITGISNHNLIDYLTKVSEFLSHLD
ncbi:MAG: hypothetical protein H7A25_10520 [Leptospiraceae bacterium]|nr:hypothetical protein [Leptospiraceae bacterium]